MSEATVTPWKEAISRVSTISTFRYIVMFISAYLLIIPDIEDIQQYINLHWGIIAVKQKQLLTAINMLLPAVFYLKAWQLFFAVTIARKLKKNNKQLSKKVLIN